MRYVDKTIVVHLYNEMLPSYKNKYRNLMFSDSMDETGEHFAK